MRRLLWLAGVAVVCASPLHGEPRPARRGLPPPEAVRDALDNHPAVLAAGHRVDVARAQAGALAKGSHEAVLAGSAMRRGVDRERDYAEFDATLTRAFRLPGKAALDRRTGEAGVAAAQNRMADARHQAALELAQLWLDWIGARALTESDQRNLANLTREAGATERRAQLRDAAALDVDQAMAAAARARGQLAESQAALAEAEAKLRATFPTIPLPATAPSPDEPGEPVEGFATLGRLVIERSHEVEAAQAEADRLGFTARRARADRIADPSVGVRAFSERGGMERGVGLVASMPLGGGYRRYLAEEAAAQSAAALSDLAAVRRTVEAIAAADVALARSRLDGWQSLRDAAVSARAVADRMRAGNRLGAIDLTDLLYAERQANDARREEIRARTEALRALIRLEIDSHVIWIDEDDHA
ncbi:TolC family protein [uncultured Sphingomonas sp.]|uniref:TolC family protein n=1 Tax=uncultured Sphingomonas sp. TaxID=158754 RepID=UPI002623E045|nr:TolC family protein [uncultured Sphingomonas sp.]